MQHHYERASCYGSVDFEGWRSCMARWAQVMDNASSLVSSSLPLLSMDWNVDYDSTALILHLTLRIWPAWLLAQSQKSTNS